MKALEHPYLWETRFGILHPISSTLTDWTLQTQSLLRRSLPAAAEREHTVPHLEHIAQQQNNSWVVWS